MPSSASGSWPSRTTTSRRRRSGAPKEFKGVWDHVAQKLLTSYSDEPYVSEAYGRELSRARTQAIQVEQTNDDPPERLSARGWERSRRASCAPST